MTPPEDLLDECRYCGQTVLVMCRLKTGFCSELCKELHETDLTGVDLL